MQILSFLVFTLSLLSSGYAASTPCKRDACYSAVGVQGSRNPNVNVRRADCRSVLRTVIDDDATSTFTSFVTETASPTITVTSTIVSTYEAPVIIARGTRAVVERPQITEAATIDNTLVFARDTIIVEGRKPAYASACKSLQDYAVACLCFGVKAQVNLIDRTITVQATVTATAATETVYETVTKINECSNPAAGCVPASGVQCNSDRGNCACFQTDLGTRCMANSGCGSACSRTSECPAGSVCEILSCCGRGNCTPLGTCSDFNSAARIFGLSAQRTSPSSGSKTLPEKRA